MFRAKVEVPLVFLSLLKKSAVFFIQIVIVHRFDVIISAVVPGLLSGTENG